MTTQYTSILKLALPVQGELSGTWGDVVNDNITSMIEEAIAGRSVINTWTANAHTLTTADGTTSESRAAMLEFTDTGAALSGNAEVICPTASKIYIAKNAVGSSRTVTLKTSAGTGIAIPDGTTMLLFCDGTNVVEAVTNINSLSVGGYTVTLAGAVSTAAAFSTAGANALTLTTTGTTNVTLPTTGTLATLAGTETFTNKTLTSPDINGGSVDNATIGATTPSTGVFTNLTANTNLTLATGATVTGINTTTDMSDASTTTLATSDSIKQYVDAQVGANNELSEVLANGNTTGANNIVVTAGQSITTDSILETTAAAGVDIDGILLKDTSVGTDDASGTDIAGTNVTLRGGAGTGTGAGGSLIFQTAPAGTTGSTVNTQVTALTIDSAGDATFTAGDVGIGTSSPIAASGYANLTLNGNSGGQVHFADNDVKVATISSSVNDLYVQSGAQTIFRNGGFTGGDEAMRIDSSGRVGIGTTPVRVLDIATTTGGTIIHLTDDATGHTATDGVDIQQEGTLFYILNREAGDIRFGTNNTERMRIDSSGNVGIQNTSPSSYYSTFSDLVVGATGSTGITIAGGTTSSNTLAFADGTTGNEAYRGYVQYTHSNDALAFGTSGTERMRISSTGSVLIAHTLANFASVGHGLQVTGNAYHTRDGGNPLNVNRLTSDGTIIDIMKDTVSVGSIASVATGKIGFYGSGGTGAVIDSSGLVGIGTTSPNTALHVSSATTTKSVVETTGASSDALIEFTKGQGSGNTWSMGIDHSNSSAFSLAYLSNGSPSLTTHGVLTVDTSGNVGIGTSSIISGARLDVRGANANNLASLDAQVLTVQDTTSYAANVGGGIAFGYKFNSAGQSIQRGAVIKAVKENATDGDYSTSMAFATVANGGQTTEKMRIASTGQLLVGSPTNPASGEVQQTLVRAGSSYLEFQNTSTNTGSTIGTSGENLIIYTNSGALGAETYTERMRVTSAGVDVTGSITATTDITISNGNNRFVAESTSAGDYVRMYGGSGTGKWDIYGNGANLRIGDNESLGLVQIDTDLYTVGNVGIGTASPSVKFHVNGGTSNTLALFESTDAGAAIAFKDGNTTTNPEVDCRTNDLVFNTGNTERMRIDASGNVGIGTQSPSSFDAAGDNLVVGTGSGNNGITVYSGTANAGSLFFADGTGSAAAKADGYIQYTHSNQALAFATGGGTERMRIDSSGVVQISNATPTLKFTDTDNNYDATIQGLSGSLVLTADSGAEFGTESIQFKTGGTERMHIDSSGNVGIGLGGASPEALLSLSKTTAGGEGGYIYIDNPATSTLDSKSGIKFGTSAGASFASTPTGEITNVVTDAGSGASALTFGTFNGTASGERLRIDSSGNLLVGTTDTTPWDNSTATSADDGIFLGGGRLGLAKWGGVPLLVNRTDSDGEIAIFYKDGSPVGSIGTTGGDLTVSSAATDHSGLRFALNNILPMKNGAIVDAAIDLGQTSGTNYRFKDLFLSGGAYLGGTGAANYLDDYEEGTWTPVYTTNAVDFDAITMDASSATYTKVGRLVTVKALIRTDSLTVGSATGNPIISGLPFSVQGFGPSATFAFSTQFTNNPVGAYAESGDTYATLRSGTGTNMLVSDMQDGTVANANYVMFCMTYETT